MSESTAAKEHDRRCAMFSNPRSLQLPTDCDCGATGPQVSEATAARTAEIERQLTDPNVYSADAEYFVEAARFLLALLRSRTGETEKLRKKADEFDYARECFSNGDLDEMELVLGRGSAIGDRSRLAEAVGETEKLREQVAHLEAVLYPPDSPQRDDASGEERGNAGVVSAEPVPTGVPHLDRACELLWQAGHPAVAEALEREVAAALAAAGQDER